jgi:hypothetical protein
VLARSFALVIAACALGGGALLGGGVAHAQPAPPPPPTAGPTAGEVTVPDNPQFPDVIQPPPGFDRDPAWTEYDGAFRDAAAGDVPAAKARLSGISARWPDHPARLRAEGLTLRRPGADGPSRVARGEFVFWSTLGGLSLAINICTAIDCSTDREYAGALTLTIGASLGASLLATRNGIHSGEAQLYNSAQTWGSWNGLLVNDGFAETPEEAGVAIAMQLGGLAAGVGLWQTWRPTAGDVALTNTFLLWGTVLTLWGHLAADEEPELSTVVIAGDIALLAGAIVSRSVKMSRGRTLLIDIGGILGTLGGGLLALATEDEEGAGVAFMVGTGAGLVIAAVGTRSWDDPPPVKVAPTVLEGPSRSKGYGLTAGFSF